MDLKCSLLQTADKKMWLFMRQADCTGGATSQGGGSSQTTAGEDADHEESIPHSTLELWRHTLLRGANAGSFVSIVVGTPVLLYKGVRQPAVFLQRLAGISTYGVGIGLALAAAMTFSRTRGNTEEQMYDRCYRLRYSKGQVLMDKVSYTGMVGGGLAGAVATPGAWARGGVQGMCLGAGLAVFAQMLVKPLVVSKDK